VPPTRESPIHTVIPDHEPADDLIRRKAAELEAVFESLGDGLLVVSANAWIVEANRAALKLLAYADTRDILHPIATSFYARAMRTDGASIGREDLGVYQALRLGETTTAECVLRPEYGGPRWIETVVSPIRDLSGEVLGAAIVARDITARRRKERDLGLIASVTDALMSADDVAAGLGGLADRCVVDLADWCAVYQLDEGTEILRLTSMRQRDGRLGAELAALLAHRPARAGEGFAGEAMRAGQSVLLPDLAEETIRRHAGNGIEAQIARRLGLRALVAAPLRGPNGSVGAICVGWTSGHRRPDDQDARLVDELARRASMAIEQARCLRALDQALGRLELVLDSMASGLLILGGDGRAILVNATAREMVALGETGIGLTLTDILSPCEEQFEDARDLDDIIARTTEMAVESQGEFRLRAPRPIDVAWLASPVRDDRGIVLGQVVVWTDVTDIRAAERVKDDLAADLSEALRLPLQTISTHAVQALRRGRRTSADTTLVHGLEVILRNARQVSMHVNDLVDAARFDASSLSLDLEEVNVHDVVQQAIDQARAMTTSHRFRLDVPPAVPPPRWDPDRIRQALLHVLSNAIKYWPDGGQIAVRVRAQLDGVVISVRDRGVGVPPEEQERVFERYFRIADDPVRHRIRGNGLGLYLVRGVVEAHGGTVWIESTGVPGEGTIVHLLLPWLPGTPTDR
jgi:PAS domain S-box-containing protein